jgi:hypothetical protein
MAWIVYYPKTWRNPMKPTNDNVDLKSVTVTVTFIGGPGDFRDAIVEKAVERFGGTINAGGVLLFTSERDLSVTLPAERVAAFKRDLEVRGMFRVDLPDDERPAA